MQVMFRSGNNALRVDGELSIWNTNGITVSVLRKQQQNMEIFCSLDTLLCKKQLQLTDVYNTDDESACYKTMLKCVMFSCNTLLYSHVMFVTS